MQEEIPSPSTSLPAKFWGPKRLVEVFREQGQPLGIAIVGGKVDVASHGPVTGIFIKNVLANSPAGRYGYNLQKILHITFRINKKINEIESYEKSIK